MKILEDCLAILFLLNGCNADIQSKLVDPTISNYLLRWPGDNASQLFALKALQKRYADRRTPDASQFIHDNIDDRIAMISPK